MVEAILLPAYGQDYKNATEVIEAWLNGKDFIYDGRYVDKGDCPKDVALIVEFDRRRRSVRVE